MEQPKIVLKVCYRGVLRYVICDRICRYDETLKTAIELFNIPKEHTAYLKISNENGYIFEPALFEYFILLFPSPEIVFYLRLDHTNTTSNAERTYPFKYSKLNNKRRHCADEVRRHGTPVRRQNCFIGSLPGTSTTLVNASNEPEIINSIAKRKRCNDFNHGSTAKTLRKHASKRSIRL